MALIPLILRPLILTQRSSLKLIEFPIRFFMQPQPDWLLRRGQFSRMPLLLFPQNRSINLRREQLLTSLGIKSLVKFILQLA